jgi:hypothetical protein
MNSLNASLEKMGPLFIVSGFIPSLAFVVFSLFAFDPILPNAIQRRIGDVSNLLGTSGIVMFITAVILGFTLTVLNNFFIKIYEGYILLKRFPFLKRSEERRERKMRLRIHLIQKLLQPYQEAGRMGQPLARKLSSLLRNQQIIFNDNFPTLQTELLPTPFGNKLKSAEFYPMDRYKINSVPMWPRLIYAIDPKFLDKITDTRNQLTFVVNCSFLCAGFAALSITASIYQGLMKKLAQHSVPELLYFLPVDLDPKIYHQRMLIYIAVAAVAMIFALVFYRASLVSVSEFGDMIRSAYDLFRFDLLEKLHYKLPEDSEKERNLWNRIEKFMLIGYAWDEPAPITYQHTPREKPDEPGKTAAPASEKPKTEQTAPPPAA